MYPPPPTPENTLLGVGPIYPAPGPPQNALWQKMGRGQGRIKFVAGTVALWNLLPICTQGSRPIRWCYMYGILTDGGFWAWAMGTDIVHRVHA